MSRKEKRIKRSSICLVAFLIMCILLPGIVTSAAPTQVYKPTFTQLTFTKQATTMGKESVANDSVLFWVPTEPGNNDWDTNWDQNEYDYCVLSYSDKALKLSNVDGSAKDGAFICSGDDNGFTNATSTVTIDDDFLDWVFPMPNGGNSDRYVAFGNYNMNTHLFSKNEKRNYLLNFDEKYNGKFYLYSNIAGKLNEIASYANIQGTSTKTGLTETDVYNMECILRLIGDYANTSAEVGGDILLCNSQWGLEGNISKTTAMYVEAGDAGEYTLVLKGGNYTEPITLDAFYSFLCKMAANKVPVDSKYTVLTSLINTVGQIEGKVAQSNENKTNNAATSLITGDPVNKTAYQKWIDTIASYIVSGGTAMRAGTSTEYNGYELNNFANWVNTYTNNTTSGAKATLNSEEVLRLQAYANCALTLTNLQRPAFPNDSFKYPTTFTDRPISGTGYNTADVKALAEVVAKDYEASGASVCSTKNVVQNLDSIVKYTAAGLYGYKQGNPFESSPDVQDLSILTSSEFLNSVTPDKTEVITTLSYAMYLPQMTKMQAVLSSQESYDAYLQLNYMLMIAATYASNDAKLELMAGSGNFGDANNRYENKDLQSFIDANASNPLTADTSSVASYIRSYLAIAKAFDYLGVKPFTPELQAIYDYQNSLLPFEENTTYQAYNPTDQDGEALSTFFSIKEGKFSEDYQIGVALSATYIPLQTNLYSDTTVRCIEDQSWIARFHYPYGFYRKALFIDTNVTAAVDKYVTTGDQAVNKRVATLGDLLEPEKDIVLYIDDNFYNINKLAEMQGYSYTKLANTDEAGKDGTNNVGQNIADWWAGYTDTDIESVAKSGSVDTYSRNVQRKAPRYQSGDEDDSDYVLSDKAIQKYLTGYSEDPYTDVYNEYTPLQSFAIVSAIYKQTSLYNTIVPEVMAQDPVFVSSPNLAGDPSVGKSEFNTIYNYIMLKNLKGSLGIDYKTTLDLDSPLYIDIYGNIATESGLVVVPAISNTTLCNPELYNVYNAGFLSLYNNGIYQLPITYNNSKEYMSDMFEPNEETGKWELKNKVINDIELNFKDIPLSNLEVVGTLRYLAIQNLHSDLMPFGHRVWILTEVLRGAPIENIDKDFEGLKGVTNINKYGIYLAYKLDEIANQLVSTTNGNSIITLPNLAFMSGVEYVILFAFKIIFALLFALLFYKIYIDAIQGVLGIKTIGSFILSLAVFLVAAFSIPSLMDTSYYQVNKKMLKNEVQYIELLNLEKQSEGREIGVYEVSAPETNTELYIKIDDLSIPWYEILDDVLFSSTFDTIGDVYDEKFDSSLMASLPGVIKKGNGLYMSVSDIFDSTSVEYLKDNNALYSNVTNTPYASYVLPYYVILDELIARVNYYNKENKIEDYTTTIQSKGAVKTLGMIEPFFTSEYFMNTSLDVTGMKYIHGIDTILEETHASFDAEDFTSMQNSLWYADGMDKEKLEEKLYNLDEYAREFVTNNRSLLGKVSDDTFLKVMAMSLAVEYNDIMGISSGNSVEIYDVDSRDILRLSLEDKKTVLEDSSKSFARFVYSNGGTLGIVFVAILLGVYFLVSVIKPVCIFIIIGSTIFTVVVRRLIKKEKSKAFEGFVITLAILCGINVLYGVLLKLLMYVPELGWTFVVAAVLQIVLQLVYVGLLTFFTVTVLRDWRDFGFNKYVQMAYKMGAIRTDHMRASASHVYIDARGITHREEGYERKERFSRSKHSRVRGRTGSEILEDMRLRDERRENR